MPHTHTDAELDRIDSELSRPDLLGSARVRLTLQRRRLAATPGDAHLSEPARTIGYDERRRIVTSWGIFRTGAFGNPTDSFADAELEVLAEELFDAEIEQLQAELREKPSAHLGEPVRGEAHTVRDAHGTDLLTFHEHGDHAG